MIFAWRPPVARPHLVSSVAGFSGPAGNTTDPPRRHEDGWKPALQRQGPLRLDVPQSPCQKVWVVCDDVRLDPADPDAAGARRAAVAQLPSVLLCGDDGRGSDIMTAKSFADYQLHLEFTVPKGSNSGVYNRGLFEIQVFDSFGKPKLGFHDCGALYERAFPSENLAKPPGSGSPMTSRLKGKKLSLVWNGKTVYQDHDVRYGETDREAFERLNQENRGKPAERASEAPRGERPLRRLLRRRRHAVQPRWPRPPGPDPAAGRPWPGGLSQYLDSTL